MATAALQLIPGVRPEMGRKSEVLADSAYIIFNRDGRTFSGNFCIDEEVLASALESVHARVRKIIKTRGHSPTDGAATKLIWLRSRASTGVIVMRHGAV